MNQTPDTRPSQTDDKPLAETGNASNPSPQTTANEPLNDNALLAAGAEEYLREGGNIEDLPDAPDQQEADRASGK